MLEILEFIALLYKVLLWTLIVLLVFWVLPSMALLTRDEFFRKQRSFVKSKPEAYQGRHWRDPQDYAKKMYIIAFVNRHRESRGGVLSHRRLSHG